MPLINLGRAAFAVSRMRVAQLIVARHPRETMTGIPTTARAAEASVTQGVTLLGGHLQASSCYEHEDTKKIQRLSCLRGAMGK